MKKKVGTEGQNKAGTCSCCSSKGKTDKSEMTSPSANRIVSFDDIVNFVEYVVKSLVDYPDEVIIEKETREGAK